MGTRASFNGALRGSSTRACGGERQVMGALGLGTLMFCSCGGGDRVRQDFEHFVGKQNPQAPSLSAAPAPKQSSSRSADLCNSYVRYLHLLLLFSLICCPVSMGTLSEYNIKHSLCKSILSEIMGGNTHQVFCSIKLPSVYNYSLSMSQTLNNKCKKG